MSLTKSQERALTVMKSGANVFLTGGAGVGKSYLLNLFIEQQRSCGKNVLVTASTGVAANNIHGTTFHRALGVFKDLDEETVFSEAGFKSLSRDKQKVIFNTDILIVDEISMLRCDAFDCGMNRLTNLPEGKKMPQIILCGDFFQLSPVIVKPNKGNGGRDDRKILKMIYGSREIIDGFAFEGEYWNKIGFKKCDLTEIVRQKDPEFAENLNKCRIGDPSCLEWFEKHAAPEEQENAPKLFGRKDLAATANVQVLNKIPGEPVTFDATITGKVTPSTSNAPSTLCLKTGARVMLLINSTALGEDATCEFQNGSIGTIEKIDQYAMQISVRLDETGELATLNRFTWTETEAQLVTEDKTGKKFKKPKIEYVETGAFKQFPLALAYAVTVHKSQGQTYDAVNVDPGSLWADGQLYVALSRARDIRKLHLYRSSDGIEKHFKTSEAVQRFYDVKIAAPHAPVPAHPAGNPLQAPASFSRQTASKDTATANAKTTEKKTAQLPEPTAALSPELTAALSGDPETTRLLEIYFFKASASDREKTRNLVKAMLRNYRVRENNGRAL